MRQTYERHGSTTLILRLNGSVQIEPCGDWDRVIVESEDLSDVSAIYTSGGVLTLQHNPYGEAADAATIVKVPRNIFVIVTPAVKEYTAHEELNVEEVRS